MTIYIRDLSPEEFEIAACWGKVGFDSYDLAKQVVQRKNFQRKTREVYKCPYCRKFHIGRRKAGPRFRVRRTHELDT